MVEVIYIVLSAIALIAVVVLVLYFIAKSKGNVKIQIDNYNYSPGDAITGKILLNIKKPLTSKSLSISLTGIQKTTSPSVGANGRRTTNTNYNTIFSFNQPLEGKKEYSPGETNYSFKIKIPSNITSKNAINPIADTLVKSVQILSGSSSAIQWHLNAELETSGFNLSDKVQINIA